MWRLLQRLSAAKYDLPRYLHQFYVCISSHLLIDVDECLFNTTICGTTTCNNTIGNYTCGSCIQGYDMVNSTCQGLFFKNLFFYLLFYVIFVLFLFLFIFLLVKLSSYLFSSSGRLWLLRECYLSQECDLHEHEFVIRMLLLCWILWQRHLLWWWVSLLSLFFFLFYFFFFYCCTYIFFSCTDINECDTNRGGCSFFATCQNRPGDWRCNCNLHYQGNGSYCSRMSISLPSVRPLWSLFYSLASPWIWLFILALCGDSICNSTYEDCITCPQDCISASCGMIIITTSSSSLPRRPLFSCVLPLSVSFLV